MLGAGGREQALAWACRLGGHDVEVRGELPGEGEPLPDLVIPGPEALLAAGVAGDCARRGIPCFGPTAEQARLESSKGFARELAASLGIPGPRFARFESRDHRAARRPGSFCARYGHLSSSARHADRNTAGPRREVS